MGLIAAVAALGIAAAPAAAVAPEPADGGPVAAATQNAPVTATAPTPVQGPEDILLPYSPHVLWEVDGYLFEGFGEDDIHDTVPQSMWPHTAQVIAHPRDDVTLTGQTQWTFTFAHPEPELIEVTATEPAFSDVDGASGDTFTIPNIEGVQYLLDGTVIAPGTYPAPHREGVYQITELYIAARAEDGYTLQGGEWEVSFYFAFDPMAQASWPAAPSFYDEPGTSNDTFVIPSVEGVQYVASVYTGGTGYAEVDAGSYRVEDLFSLAGEQYVLEVEARPMDGYRLPTEAWEDLHFEFSYGAAEQGDDKPGEDAVVVDIPEITVIDADGVDGDKLIFPDAEGVSYLVFVFDGLDGAGFPDHSEYVTGEVAAHEFASFPQPDSYQVLVTVIADEGYVFPDERPSVDIDFEFSTLTDGEPAPTVVHLPEVYKTEIDGQEGYLLPQFSGGFIWYVNGKAIDHWINEGKARFVPAPGTGMSVSATGGLYEITADGMGVDIDDIVIAAVAQDGYVLTTADGEPMDTVVVADARTGVELESPTVVDAFGTEDDTFTIPDVPGLVFTDEDGNVLEPGEHPVTAEYVDGEATVILTASAADGYRLEVDGQAVETTPGGTGSHTLTLTFTDATAPVDDEDDTEPGDDTPGPGESDEDTEEPGQSDEEEADESGGDQPGDHDATEDLGTGLDIEFGADQDTDGADAGDSDETDDGRSVKQDDSKQDDAAEVTSLAESGAGGTLAAGLIAMALLMAGVTLTIARRTTQVR